MYNTHQQRIQYIVEFTLSGETPVGGSVGDNGGQDQVSEEKKPVDEGKRCPWYCKAHQSIRCPPHSESV